VKIFKITMLIIAFGLGAFFYTNPYMVKPLLKQVAKVQVSMKEYFSSSEVKPSITEVAVLNTYKIDSAITNKEEYYVDSRVKNMYIEMSRSMIKRDIEIRKRLLYVQDKCPEEITTFMAALEPRYDLEREKVENYCKNGSKNCFIEVSLTGNSVEGSDVEMKVNYILDKQSQEFFNQVNHVHKLEDKWYDASFVGINEHRYYPKMGKFQERSQKSFLKDDTNSRVDITDILEGNSNEWNVRFNKNITLALVSSKQRQ